MSDSVIEIENLAKRYHIGPSRGGGRGLAGLPRKLARRALSAAFPKRWPPRDQVSDTEFWALKNLTCNIRRGEAVGIVGRNGAGKSTLLKILSRVTSPTAGQITIRGRVGSLLEVGTGFHPELSGRENIYLNGVTLGLKKAEIQRRFDEIVAFSELEKFIDTPVKHYSSGMYMRLAFSVAAHLLAEIMIIDEVLAVGDASFQKKCLSKMENVASRGRTVLFVSHSMGAVQSLCTRALLLENGQLTMDDTPDAVAARYLTTDEAAFSTCISFEPDPALRLQVLEARLLDPVQCPTGLHVPFVCTYVARREVPDVMLCIDVKNISGISVFYANDDSLAEPSKRKIGTHRVTCLIPKYLLAPGEYRVLFGFWQPGHPPEHFPATTLGFVQPEIITRLASHKVAWPSIICLPAQWTYNDHRRDS